MIPDGSTLVTNAAICRPLNIRRLTAQFGTEGATGGLTTMWVGHRWTSEQPAHVEFGPTNQKTLATILPQRQIPCGGPPTSVGDKSPTPDLFSIY